MGMTSSRVGMGMLFGMGFFLLSSGAAFADSHAPTTQLGPEEVVRIQLDAFRRAF
ncbi:MAG: hypothetical protein ACQETQ_11640 [Spirochaetota bacterium]